jgi:hypothetical protein
VHRLSKSRVGRPVQRNLGKSRYLVEKIKDGFHKLSGCRHPGTLTMAGPLWTSSQLIISQPRGAGRIPFHRVNLP